MEKYISAYIVTFYIYGFAGWIWESLICPIMTRHRIKNSGFLNGPIVPIYGLEPSLSLFYFLLMKVIYLFLLKEHLWPV